MPTVSVYADRDAFTFSTIDGQVLNYGDSVNLAVQNDQAGGEHYWANRAFWGFTFSIPGTITAATMYLYQNASNNVWALNPYWYTCSTFAEYSITWNNQPGPGSSLGAAGQTNGWNSVSVNGYISANGTHCFCAMGNPEQVAWDASIGWLYYSSKESGTSPYVSVTYNVAPSTPGAWTVPASGVTYPVAEPITLTHGSSTDADGDTITYYREVSINGGGWAAIGNSTSTTQSYTPTQAGTYAFRVRAYDGVSSYSAYQTSATVTVGGAKKRMIVG